MNTFVRLGWALQCSRINCWLYLFFLLLNRI